MLRGILAHRFRCWLLLTLLVLAAACGDASEQARQAPQDSSANPAVSEPAGPANPDASPWHDLRKLLFRKEWIGGKLIIGRTRGPATLHNLLWSSEEDRPYAKHFLHPYLLVEEPDRTEQGMVCTPCAAASLPVRAAEPRTWVYTLRDDLTWEDGHAVTSADYAASFEAIRDPKVRADARRAQIDGAVALRVIDPRSFAVEFADDHVLAPIHFGLQFTVAPAASMPAERAGMNTQRQHASFGAYRIADWTPAHLLLELRAEYRTRMPPTGPAYLEQVEFVFEPEEARVAGLREGRVDLDTVRHELYGTLESDAAFQEHCWLTWYFLPNQAVIVWNLRDPADAQKAHPLLGAVAVRRALGMLIPRDELARTIYGGRAVPVSGPAWRRDGDYDTSVAATPFDPGTAQELLLAAGCTLQSDGWLERGGKRLTLSLMLPQGVAWAEAPALRFQEAARSIGLSVELRKLPFNTLVTELQAKRHDAALILNSLRPPVEYDFLPDFHSRYATMPAANLCGLSDPETDTLLELARGAAGRGERRDARRALHRRLDQLQPCAFLYSPASCVAVSRRFANVKVHDLGLWYRDFVLRSAFEAAPPPR